MKGDPHGEQHWDVLLQSEQTQSLPTLRVWVLWGLLGAALPVGQVLLAWDGHSCHGPAWCRRGLAAGEWRG